MEVALRRRLEGVADISISQRQQTAAVTFVSGTHAFSPAAFEESVAEADVEVISLEVDVCGVVDNENVLRSATDQQQRIVRLRGRGGRSGSTICVTGRLDQRSVPPEVEVTRPLP